jgi:hypothetical protein
MSNNVAVVGIVTLAILAGASSAERAAAQSSPLPFTAQQCGQIRSNILGIFKRYNGQLSGELVADLQEFSRKDCDRSVKLRMMSGTKDKDAVAELKVLIAAR